MARLDTVTFTGSLTIEHCCRCGMTFGIPSDLQRRLVQSHESFYCPLGHSQQYIGKTDAQKAEERAAKAERQLVAQRAETDRAQAEAAHQAAKARGYKGAMVQTKKRAAKGVCPVAGCRRHFVDVERHVATKHPNFAVDPEAAS